MKLGPLQSSFVASIAFHAVAFGVIAVIVGGRKPLPATGDVPPAVLTIIAGLEREEEETPPAPISQDKSPHSGAPEPFQPVVEQVAATPGPQMPSEVPAAPKPAEAALAMLDKLPMGPDPKALVATVSTVRSDERQNVTVAPLADAPVVVAQPAGTRAQPNYRKNPEPAYPPRARRLGLEGLVLLDVKVSTEGRAVEVAIKQSSGHDILDTAALKAVRDWEFQPARIGQLPVESRIEVPVRFQLVR